MKMFEATYLACCKPVAKKVYAVNLGEDGKTYFLIFTSGEWRWVESCCFEP